MKRVIYIFILLICLGCNSQSQDLIVYRAGGDVPELILSDASLKPIGSQFSNLFEKVFGNKIDMVARSSEKQISIKLGLLKKDKEKNYFIISADSKSVRIEGTNTDEVSRGVHYFLRKYAGMYYVSGKGIVTNESKLITVPHDLYYTQSYAFEYREPYFPDNYDVEFRSWYATHTMEDTWAMWGHNLSKVVKPSTQMMARVNGKVNEEQFCFSSPELEEALIHFIKKIAVDEPLRSKFMIQANDNDVVCQCDRCKAIGNTLNNASPAVFSLINMLAAKFPKQQFFSTAYVTTMHPPKFKLADNAGVMVSTMAFPKGVLLETSGKKAMIDKVFAEWNKVTNTIYLWDYAINFDNYFKSYPTMLIAQANLKYYKAQGVKGVFMQGSEDQYSAYADLKSYLYALLLQDPDIDVRKEIKVFFKTKYPLVADLLSDYYLKIEQRSFDKKTPLDIYGGIKESKKKYLEEVEFNTFYNALFKKSETLPKDELNDLKPLLVSLTFIKLELLRTNGIGTFGYKPASDEKINHEVDVMLQQLWELSSQTGIKTYTETGLLIKDYLDEWNTEIIKKPYSNLLYGKKLKLISTPDEEYTDVTVLTDGGIGFKDYYNNWMLFTQDALEVEVSAKDIKGAKVIEMDFLQDKRHNIYTPEKVEVTIDGRKYEKKLELNEDAEISKRHINIQIDIKPSDTLIDIKTIKASQYKNKSIACDEIFFKK